MAVVKRALGVQCVRFVAAGGLGLAALSSLAASRPALGREVQMGPQDVAVIPIESVPGWVTENVAREVLADGESGIEVLAVIRDPRDVPVDRFVYALTDEREVLVHPQAEAIRGSLEARGHSAVAVYVRVTAPAEICEDCYEGDPFFVETLENMGLNPDSNSGLPWDGVGVTYGEDGVAVLPCLEPMTIDSRARAFRAPDTGGRVQPDEYLPPTPQYVVTDNRENPDLLQGEMAAGEVREGWLLCLAPDAPADQLRIVTTYKDRATRTSYVGSLPLWVPFRKLAIGEWYFLDGRQVLGWNEDPAETRDGEAVHLDEQVVYEGDVWVSVAQALRHVQDPRVDSDGIGYEPFEEELRLQMWFEGMDGLLGQWDQLALQDGLELSVGRDVDNAWQTWSGETIDLHAQGTRLTVGRSSLIVGERRYTEPQEALWVYLGDMRKPVGTGAVQLWHVEFDEIDERDLTTDAVCVVAECRRVQVEVGFDEYEERLLPVVPVGSRAFGLTVVSARFVGAPILYLGDLLTSLDEGSLSGGPWKLLVIGAETEWVSGAYPVRLGDDGSIQRAGGRTNYLDGRRYDLGVSGGRPVFGGDWESLVRSARESAVLLYEVPSDWQLGQIVLMRDGGAIWRLK